MLAGVRGGIGHDVDTMFVEASKRECRDEMQKRGSRWQVRRERLSMGSGLAERLIWAHNLLEYMDR